MSPNLIDSYALVDATKPYKFIKFGARCVTTPYEFIGFGAMEAPTLSIYRLWGQE
jgi:hypothetical protein